MQDFNPRPREEGDPIRADSWCNLPISIHALVKRATEDTDIWTQNYFISIHALVKRATRRAFDFRLKKKISIHALVKRATLKSD